MKTALALFVSLVIADVAALAADIQPLMVRRGAPLLDESFKGPLDTTKWTVAIGDWKVEDGTLVGTERPEDHHPAVIKTAFTQTKALVQFSFQLKGDSSFHFSLNDAGGHNSRVVVHSNSVTMRKDLDKKDPRSYARQLDEAGASIAPDAWHTMLVELNGPEMLIHIDNDLVLYGTDPGIDKEKTDFGFPVSGSAQFDNVKVWKATPSPTWRTEKTKLQARLAARPAVDRAGNLMEAFQVAEGKARDRLVKSDPKFTALVDARAKVQEEIAKAFPVVNRKGEKADAEKKRLAAEDDNFKKLTADLRVAQKNERDYLLAQDAEAKKAWDAYAASIPAKAKVKPAPAKP